MTQNNAHDSKFGRALLLLCLVVFGVAAYANTFTNPFVYDDINYITLNDPHVHMTELSLDQLKEAIFKGKPRHRPIANLSFALNYWLGGENPLGFHVVNLCIHLLTALFLFFIFSDVLQRNSIISKTRSRGWTDGGISFNMTWAAFFAALLWLVHPVQTNAVTYMVQRMTSLAVMFFVLSLLLYIKGRHAAARGRFKTAAGWFIGCLAAGLCAVFTKQNTATLPLFILLYEWFFYQDLRISKNAWIWIGGAIAISVFAAIGFHYLGGDPVGRILSAYQRREFTMPQRVLTEWRVVAYYLSLAAFPLPSRMVLDHDYPLSHSLIDPTATLMAGVMILSLIALALATAKRQRLFSFCLLWFLGNLVIESSVIGIEIIYEHRLYLPSMMMFPVAALLILKLTRARWPIFVIAVILTLLSLQRNQIWSSAVAFWQDGVIKAPEKERPLQNLAYSLQQEGRLEEALKYYKKSLSRPNSGAVYNMGLAYSHLEQWFPAADAFITAIKMGYQPAGIHQKLAYALEHMGEFQGALHHYRIAAQRMPNNAAVQNQMEALSEYLAQCGDELACLNRRSRQQPDNPSLHYKKGVLLEEKGEWEAARDAYLLAYHLQEASAAQFFLLTLNRLAAINEKSGRTDHAIALYRKGIELAPDNLHFYHQLAAVYANTGHPEKAVGILERAVEKGFNNWAAVEQDGRFDAIKQMSAFNDLKRKGSASNNN